MALTVPKAGIIAGRAPNTGAIPVPQSNLGGVMADFGAKMAQVGQQMETDRLQRDLGRARVSMMQGLNNLGLEFEQIGDPDTIDREFMPKTEELKQELFQSIDPKNQEDAGLIFDEMRAAQGAKLGARAIDLRQSQRRADLDALSDTVVQSWAGSTPEMKRVAMGTLDDQLDQLLSSGAITPEEAQTYRLKTVRSGVSTEANRDLTSDPQKFLTDLETGKYPDLDAQTRETLRSTATSHIAVNRKAAVASAKTYFTEGKKVIALGRDWAGAPDAERMLSDPEIAALPEAREYIAQRDLNAGLPEFARLPLQKKIELAQAEAAKPIEGDYDDSRLKAMQSAIDIEKKGFAEDPVEMARKLNLPAAPQIADIATSSGDDLARSIAARANWSSALNISAMFSADERRALTEAIGPDKSPSDRARIAGALYAALPAPAARSAIGEIGGDPVFSAVGSMLSNGGNDVTARQIFEGQRMSRDHLAKAPSKKDLGTSFTQTFGNLFEDGTGPMADQGDVRRGVMEAANALYLFKTGRDADSDDFDDAQYKQAVFETLGGKGEFGDAGSIGGLYPVTSPQGRDYDLPIPAGRKGIEVDAAFDWMREQAFAPQNSPVTAKANTEKAVRQGPDLWSRISTDGSSPGWKGKTLDSDTFSKTNFRYIGNDRYVLTVQNPATGRTEAIYDENGKAPWVVDIGKLLLQSGAGK